MTHPAIKIDDFPSATSRDFFVVDNFRLAYFEDGFRRPYPIAFLFSYSLSPPLSKRQRNYSRRSSQVDRCFIVDRNCGTGGIGYLITGLDTESLLMSKQMKRRSV